MKAVIFLLSMASLLLQISSQNCERLLPSHHVIENGINQLLSSHHNSSIRVALSDYHFVCKAPGIVGGTYSSVSIVASYTANGNSISRSYFAMHCVQWSWKPEGDLSPYTGLLNSTRTDCFKCSSNLMDQCQVCSLRHCSICGSDNCCRVCSRSGHYIIFWDNCTCISYDGYLSFLFFFIAILYLVAGGILIIVLSLIRYRKCIFRRKKMKMSAVLYEDANEMVSKCTQEALRNKATLTQSSLANKPVPTSQDVYESLDEQDSHQNSPRPQNISLGANPSYSKVILKAMETEHNPAYQQMSNLAGMITQNPSEVVGIESNPSYQAHTSIAGHESIDLPLQHNAAYQQLGDVGVIAQNLPEDMGIESNPSYQACTSIAGHKSIDLPLQHNAAYQQMSNVGMITQNSPEDMGIEPNPSYTATRHHLSNPQLQRNATYETIDEVKIPNDPVSTHPIYETNIDTAVDTDAKVSEVEDDSYVDADYDANDDINDDVNDDVNDVDYI